MQYDQRHPGIFPARAIPGAVDLIRSFSPVYTIGATLSTHNSNDTYLFIRALYISLIIFFARKRIIFVLAMVSPIISLISS